MYSLIKIKHQKLSDQRALGMSMKVERSTAEQIRNKLAKVNQKKEGHQEYGW